jgi:uncharacterized Fe-S cluster-containing radical SAM superfamily protein
MRVMQINRETSKTICPLPFMHTYITANGSAVACCESQESILSPSTNNFQAMWNSQDYKNLRQALLQGEKPEVCRKCWSNEEIGMPSNREDMWRDFETGLFGKPSLNVNEDFSVSPAPVAIEIKTNNLCNLKCRMCHPESSHRVGEDKEIIVKYRKNLPWSQTVLSSAQTVGAFFSEGDTFFKNLSVVQYSGGEPLISDEQLDLTKKLLQFEPENIHLRYSTNLTHLSYKQTSYPDIWKNFKKIHVKVSIDGVNDVYDYIRVGGQFEKVVGNIKKLQDFQLPNLQLSIGFTTQAYNVFQLPEFLEYFEKIVPRSAITTHLLHSPKMMMVDVYPLAIRERLIHKLQSRRSDLGNVISVLQKSSQEAPYWTALCNYTRELETKYSVGFGFHSLLEKYLADY